MTNPKTSPVAESVVEQVIEALRKAPLWLDQDGTATVEVYGVTDVELRKLADAAIAAMPRPIEDDTPTDAGEGVECASSACPVCGLNEPHQHNSLDAMELRGRRFPITNDEWLRYVGRIIDPATVNELDMLHKKAVRLATLPSHPTPADTGLVGELVEALEPFLRHWQPWMDGTDATDDGSFNHSNDNPMSSFALVTFGDLRRARTALSKAKESL